MDDPVWSVCETRSIDESFDEPNVIVQSEPVTTVSPGNKSPKLVAAPPEAHAGVIDVALATVALTNTFDETAAAEPGSSSDNSVSAASITRRIPRALLINVLSAYRYASLNLPRANVGQPRSELQVRSARVRHGAPRPAYNPSVSIITN